MSYLSNAPKVQDVFLIRRLPTGCKIVHRGSRKIGGHKVYSIKNRGCSVGDGRIVHSVITKGSIKVVYQPIVDHRQNQVLGYEALTRPMLDGSMIRPDDWFRAAHDCQCNVEAELFALSCIFGDVVSLSNTVVSTPIFVNVMPSSLQELDFLKALESMIDQGACNPKQLVFEIVEYIDYDPMLLSDAIDILRSFGIRIALDDYGTKEAHTGALSVLNPEFIKLDRSLINLIVDSTSKRDWLTNLVNRLPLDSSVIVEGIESPEHLLLVRETGIAFSQGYYWGRPVPSTELDHLIIQIESEKMNLEKIVQRKQGLLTSPEVIGKSLEIDRLIVQYYHAELNRVPEPDVL